MANPKLRYLVSQEIGFRSQYGHGLPMKLVDEGEKADVLSVLQAAVNAKKAQIQLGEHDFVRITSLSIADGKNMLIMMFRRSDLDGSTPVVESRTTGLLRSLDKTEDDALAVCAHFFVDMRPSSNAYTHKALLEEVPGIGRTYVQAVLGRVLREFKYLYTEKSGQESETYTLPSVNGVRAERMGDVAGECTIPYIKLIRRQPEGGFDLPEGVVAKPERMKLIVSAAPADAVGVVERVKNWAYGRDWSDVRVQIQTPDDRTRLISVGRDADAADVLFLKTTQVHLETPVPDASETFHDELASKASELLG